MYLLYHFSVFCGLCLFLLGIRNINYHHKNVVHLLINQCDLILSILFIRSCCNSNIFIRRTFSSVQRCWCLTGSPQPETRCYTEVTGSSTSVPKMKSSRVESLCKHFLLVLIKERERERHGERREGQTEICTADNDNTSGHQSVGLQPSVVGTSTHTSTQPTARHCCLCTVPTVFPCNFPRTADPLGTLCRSG